MMNLLVISFQTLILIVFRGQFKHYCKCDQLSNFSQRINRRTREIRTEDLDRACITLLYATFYTGENYYDISKWIEAKWDTMSKYHSQVYYPLGVASVLTNKYLLTSYSALLLDDMQSSSSLWHKYLHVGAGRETLHQVLMQKKNFQKAKNVHVHEEYNPPNAYGPAKNDLVIIELESELIGDVSPTCFLLDPIDKLLNIYNPYTFAYSTNPRISNGRKYNDIYGDFSHYQRNMPHPFWYELYYNPSFETKKIITLQRTDADEKNYPHCTKFKHQICFRASTRDCPGDLGIPLYLFDSYDNWIGQVGWASFVSRLDKSYCHPYYFVRFALINIYIEWIEDKIGKKVCVSTLPNTTTTIKATTTTTTTKATTTTEATTTTTEATTTEETTTKNIIITTRKIATTKLKTQTQSTQTTHTQSFTRFRKQELIDPSQIILILALILFALFVATVIYVWLKQSRKRQFEKMDKSKNYTKKTGTKMKEIDKLKAFRKTRGRKA